MKKYRVTYYFHTCADVDVEAEDEMEALEKAADDSIDKQIVANAIEIDKPDVELIKED